MKDMKNDFKLPHVGQRIIRSVCAVCLCFIVYFLRGCQGIPFYSALAVLQCMQPYRSSSFKMAKKRSIGTFIGAFGVLVIMIQIYATGWTDHWNIFELHADLSIYRSCYLFNGCTELQK